MVIINKIINGLTNLSGEIDLTLQVFFPKLKW